MRGIYPYSPTNGFSEDDCEICRKFPCCTRVNHLSLCFACHRDLTSTEIKHHHNIFDEINDDDDDIKPSYQLSSKE